MTKAVPAADDARAVALGRPLPEALGEPERLIEAVASRLRLWPGGELWTCDDSGRPLGASYASLWRRSLAIGAGLGARKVEPGRIVALTTGDALEFAAAFWGCLRAGCVILPLTRRARHGGAEALGQILSRVVDPLVLTDTPSEALAREAAERLGVTVMTLAELEESDPADGPAEPARLPSGSPACLVPTSGSTGQVKLAALSQGALIRRRFVRSAPAAEQDRTHLFVFDLDTVTGLNAVFPQTPRHVQIAPSLVAGRPLLVIDALERHGVARMTLTSSLAGLIADALERTDRTWDLSRLEQVNLGAERVDPFVASRLADALRRCGAGDVKFVAAYGATETGTLATGARIPRAGSAAEASGPMGLGGPAGGVSLRIVDDSGHLRQFGEVGQIEARAPGLMFSGYWGDEAASVASLTDDGWWRTGDLGALQDSQLWLHGRAKDVIIARGRKHALGDIDAKLQGVLGQFPFSDGSRVLSCAVQRPGEATEQLAVVVFGEGRPTSGRRELLERALRRAAAMEFGLNPAVIVYAAMTDLPLGPGGKVIRRAVADLAPLPPPAAAVGMGAGAGALERLTELWRQVLASPGPVTLQSDFFELGGDSLASEQLFAGLETRFGRRISPEGFFSAPTLGNLLELLEHSGVARSGAESEPPLWPLPARLREKLLTRLETWPGERPTPDRLMAGMNVSGSLPPLFWIFQGGEEFAALGDALGPDQPLYGFRSGHLVFRYTEDQIQQVALQYVHDILEVSPKGPLFLGANCQGGVIALAAAQHLARRRRTPGLLVLMEWGFELQPYPGKVLFLHGADSLQGNPFLRHQDPERAWRRLLAEYDVEEIAGAHGGYFMEGNVEPLAGALSRHLARAVSEPPRILAFSAEDARLSLKQPPQRMAPGETLRLGVEVRNVGNAAWAGAEACGLMLGDHWLGAGGEVERWVDARTPLPPLEPGEAATLWLDIAAPLRPGRFTLVVDLVEEGNRWLDRRRRRAPSVEITVEGP